MPPVLRFVFAALWALPGPILVGVFLAVIFGPYEFYGGSVEAYVDTVRNNLSNRAFWFYVQASLALLYGVFRAACRSSSPSNGAIWGMAVWSAVGALFLIVELVTQEAFYFGWPPRYWYTSPTAIAWGYFCRFVGHIVGGAIAGFHVEYFLLHWGRVRGGNGCQPFTE